VAEQLSKIASLPLRKKFESEEISKYSWDSQGGGREAPGSICNRCGWQLLFEDTYCPSCNDKPLQPLPQKTETIREYDSPDVVSKNLDRYLAKMKTKKRLEIAILISGLSFVGILWIWILALLWMWYRKLEEDFVKLWSTFPEFIPAEPFRSIFNEESHSLLTRGTFLITLKRRNYFKSIVVGALCIPLYGWCFIFFLPIFLPLIVLLLVSIIILRLGFWSDYLNSVFSVIFVLGFILENILLAIIVFRKGIRSPFTEELKTQTKQRNPVIKF